MEGVRKRVQDDMVGKVVDLVKVEGWVAGRFVEEKVKEVYAAARRERGVKDTNLVYSVKVLVVRVMVALKGEGWLRWESMW